MFYAHQGSRNDNAFTTYNGRPTRRFKAFKTKKERQEYQDKIWKETDDNVIFCDRKFVEKWHGRDFSISGNDVIREGAYLD